MAKSSRPGSVLLRESWGLDLFENLEAPDVPMVHLCVHSRAERTIHIDECYSFKEVSTSWTSRIRSVSV